MAAEEITSEREEKALDADLGAIEDALGKARAELAAITEAASTADSLADDSAADYSLHEVLGIGRYAVVRRTGWRALLNVIHDPAANIDFSANLYPGFDNIIGQNFQSPYLLDPLNEKYDSYHDLRDNIAAVRNVIMEHYYVDTPPGMTPEKAKQALNEIATYVGKGLNNNYMFLGILPNHRLGEPFISIEEASQPGGAGAQYLYEKILEMHRQSNWMRPFAPIIALFGGHTPPDWMLPPAHETEFTELYSQDITDTTAVAGPSSAALKGSIAAVETLEAKRQRVIDAHTLGHTAIDLSAMGDQLLHSANGMKDVAQLSEPVRRDAIEIAKDILRKLRGSLGNITVKDGLNLPPKDDASTLGALKGVALIYERMVGWARTVDPSIMQHPSVVTGVQAIGQLGVMAKLEALRIAKLVGNNRLVDQISDELSRIPPAYKPGPTTKFAELMDRIESGMNTMLSRVQTISGPTAQIGNSASNDLGNSINQAPTAGMSQQISNSTTNDGAKRNAEILAAENAFKQAQQARQSQQTSRQSISTTTTTTTTQQQPAQRATTTVGRAAPSNRTAPVRPNTTNSTAAPTFSAPTSTRPAGQNNDAARLARMDRERQEAEQRTQQEAIRLQQQKAIQKAAAAKMAVQKIDPSLLKGFQTATSTKGMGPVAPVKKPIAPLTPPTPTNHVNATLQQKQNSALVDDKNPHAPIPPQGRGGRGF